MGHVSLRKNYLCIHSAYPGEAVRHILSSDAWRCYAKSKNLVPVPIPDPVEMQIMMQIGL